MAKKKASANKGSSYTQKSPGGHGHHPSHGKHNKYHNLPADAYGNSGMSYGAGTPMTSNYSAPGPAPMIGGPEGGSTPGTMGENACNEDGEV